jgi:AraC family transcriptional regulator
MDEHIPSTAGSHRDRWLALLEKYEIGRPKSLHVVEVPGGLVQATVGELPGRLRIEAVPANVLMFNMSPVQGLRQSRDGSSFVSDALRGEMILMPRGIPSEWSWNSSCDRLDVVLATDVFGDGSELDVINRFLFRDSEIEATCHRLYREIDLNRAADRLYVESLVAQLAARLFKYHSRASASATAVPREGLTRLQAKRVVEYVESNLSRELTLRELASIASLSLYHFARMFKRTMGVAPHRYVVERRIERAKTMLRRSGAPLVEVSLSTGFCGQSHFTSTFRRVVGATPTAFKESCRGNRS